MILKLPGTCLDALPRPACPRWQPCSLQDAWELCRRDQPRRTVSSCRGWAPMSRSRRFSATNQQKLEKFRYQRPKLCRVYLLSLAKLLQDVDGHLVVLEQVIWHGIADPGNTLSGPQLQQLVLGVPVTFQISGLNLQQRQVAKNLKVLLSKSTKHSFSENDQQRARQDGWSPRSE